MKTKAEVLRERGGVQFITHETPAISYVESARLALAGGCRWVQLRMKGASDNEAEAVAREVQSLCRAAGATFVIDDRVELVRRLDADGVHLGRNDMPVPEARRLLGTDCIIGGTANTFDDVARLAAEGADYVGCGPFRFTMTKQNLSPILGLAGYADITRRMRAAGIGLPIVAIGGIANADIPAILATGVTGIALSGSILRAAAPADEMRRVMALVRAGTDAGDGHDADGTEQSI